MTFQAVHLHGVSNIQAYTFQYLMAKIFLSRYMVSSTQCKITSLMSNTILTHLQRMHRKCELVK